MPEPLSVCLVASELAPFAKTGGLGEVCAALGRYLHKAGHDVRPFLPLYSRIDTRTHSIVPVEFLQDVPLAMGGRALTFSVYTSPLPGSSLPVYLVHCPALYDRPGFYTQDPDEGVRFAFLSRAAIESCQRMGWGPQVFHCNDWHTALIPLYLRTLYSWDRLFQRTRTVLTLHNVGYQGIFGAHLLDELGLAGSREHLPQDDLAAGRVSFLKAGILYSGVLTTVSRTHAREIQSEAYGMGLQGMLRARSHHLVGIANGIDYDEWNPERDPHLPHPYSRQDLSGKAGNKRHLLDGFGLDGGEGAPLAGIVSRLTVQKGFDLCFTVLPALLSQRDLRLAVLGSGEARYEQLFAWLRESFPGRVGFYRGYSEPLAHLVEAGADLFLMPSRYEPCGLNQMYSQRYGTPPVVRRTGGLADTVEPYDPASGRGTGFVFEHFTPEGFRWALELALDTHRNREAWLRLVRNGMARDFSWDSQIDQYVALYRALVEGRL